MKKTLAELAELTGATIQGNGDCVITGVATLNDAKQGDLSFLHNIKYKKFLPETQASAVILSADVAENCQTNALISDDPYYAYTQVASLLQYKPANKAGIHATAVVGENCDIDSTACIGPNVVIGDHVKIGANTSIGAGTVVESFCEIGESCDIHANVTLYHHARIGSRVTIFSGVVIASDGFGNAMHQGKWHKVPQLGTVVIEDDVEIGSNTTIDRGALGDTIIRRGARLDNLIQIGHNIEIGECTAIAACTAIAGSVKIGKYCLIGGATTINGHISICDKTIITGMSGVAHSIREPGIYSSGHIAEKNATWRKNVVRFLQLDKMARRLRKLELKLEGENND